MAFLMRQGTGNRVRGVAASLVHMDGAAVRSSEATVFGAQRCCNVVVASEKME